MQAQGTFVLVWLLAGVFAVAMSIVVGRLGEPFLFAGALGGGPIGVAVGVWLAGRLGWLAASELRLAFIGGSLGFFVAAPIAVLNLHSPVAPVLSCALAGAAALVGAGFSRRSRP